MLQIPRFSIGSGWPGAMRFDVYGRFQLEVVREDGRWTIFRLDQGKRCKMSDFVIPASLRSEELATYLDDMLHEWARSGEVIRRID